MTRSHTLDRIMVAGIVGLGLAAVTGLVIVPHLRGGHESHADEPHAKPAAEVPVTLAKAALRPVERRVGVVGTLEGFEEVAITPKVEGRVATLYRDVGDVLSPGEPLLLLDDVDYRLAASEAERGLELELARIGMEAMGDKLDLNKVAMVVRARDMEENARTVLE
ncbi:MAG: biotin/lipoyl-binding protein, partial [Gemmataceae bacterium]